MGSETKVSPTHTWSRNFDKLPKTKWFVFTRQTMKNVNKTPINIAQVYNNNVYKHNNSVYDLPRDSHNMAKQ